MNHIAILGAAAILACGLSYTVGRIQGSAAAEVECAQATTQANAEALDTYRAAVEAQAAEDRAQSLKDSAAIERATARLAESARRLEKARAAPIPAGHCVLSQEWVRVYDDAR